MARMNDNGFIEMSGNYRDLIFYKKTKVLYDMTFWFKNKYLSHGDRTQDQMVQAARSGKQNIAEGVEDGLLSAEMELKLVNVARASLVELREDYEDYLMAHRLLCWDASHERYKKMVDYCYAHNELADYQKYYEQWSEEEFCNVALTLLHQADRGICNWLKIKERVFIEGGGIREKMSLARRTAREKEIKN